LTSSVRPCMCLIQRGAQGGRELLESIHFDMCDKLLQGMADCIESCFDGWQVDQSKWKFVCHEYLSEPIARYGELCSIVFCYASTRLYESPVSHVHLQC
jgi:hypothetical protein